MSGAICCACKITRPLGALLAVTDRMTGRTRFVCRPSLPQLRLGRPCFGVVQPAAVEAIAFALDERPESAQVLERKAKRQAEAVHVARLAAAITEQQAVENLQLLAVAR